MISYPNGYGTQRVTLDEMKAEHGGKMHPEFERRFFAYMESKGGLLGVGGGWRATGTQPDESGFAPEGKSFHQSQTFASGIVAYCAVDLVKTNDGGKHVSPAWADTADAPEYDLHTFIDGEPWHIQPSEIRGWQSWKNAGSPDPVATIAPRSENDSVYTLNRPIRMLDTRNELEGLLPSGIWPQRVPVGVPASASAIFVTVTATEAESPGFVTLWGSGDMPEISNLNYQAGDIATGNTTLCRVVNGQFELFNVTACHVILDVLGYTVEVGS